MQDQQDANLAARIRFRRFFGTARRYWEDGRYSGVRVTRLSCFTYAAQHHGIAQAQFERLHSTCFADRQDRLDAFQERLDIVRDCKDRH